MESLAVVVAKLILIAFLAGPIAIALTMRKSDSRILNVFRKLLHGFFVFMSLWVGMMFFSNSSPPFAVNLIGLFGLITAYIALRREYFPHILIVSPLLEKLGVKAKTNSEGGELQGDPKFSRFGPILKRQRSGGSGGKDGHGPSGQH